MNQSITYDAANCQAPNKWAIRTALAALLAVALPDLVWTSLYAVSFF